MEERMKKYDAVDIRNIALVGHKGAGKTSLAEACIFNAKAVTRLGSVDAKTSTFDYEQEEMDRGMTIMTTVGSIEWKKRKINILDTPGDGNFIYDTRLSMTAADAALVVISAPDGIGVQTERVWERARELDIPRVILINKMDRERADPDSALKAVKSVLSSDAIPVQIPIGKEANFEGVVDVLSGKAFFFQKDGSGAMKTGEVPAALQEALVQAKSALSEKIAESDEALVEKFLESGLSDEELITGFSNAVKNGALFPVMYVSASRNMGIQPVLDFVSDRLPTPTELPPIKGKSPDGREVERARAPSEPLCAVVFKTIDAQGGTLSIFRILSGSISGDSLLYNSVTETDERVGTLLSLLGKKQEAASAAEAGDIVGVLKFKSTSTGHTLCDKKAPMIVSMLPVPPPAISFAVKAKSKGDEDKLGSSLGRMLSEDPSLRVSRDEDTKDFLLSGMGSGHIDLAVNRMKRRFGVQVSLEMPKVPYRETITKKAQAQGRHKRQTGGRGQFGDCWLELSPLARGGGFEFENRIKGGAIPGQFIPAVEKGVIETLQRGVLAGFKFVDVKVAVYDGSYHEVDSSEMAFKRAASIGFKAAVAKANPILLEPIHNMEIVVPEDKMGDIIGDMNSRRGRVSGMETRGRMSVIKVQVPLAEILSYSSDLDSRTGGRGSFTMEFSHYQELPAHLAEKVIAAHKPTAEEEED
jgi:elongation factor G